MKRAGFWSGPGPTGTFTDTTAAARRYLATRGDRCAFVDLYEFRLLTIGTPDLTTGGVTGLVLRHAQADYDVPFEGVMYAGGGAARGWRLSRKGIKTEIGTMVSDLEIDLMLDGTDLLPPADGNPATPQFGLGEAIHGGILDLAHVTLRRLILPAHPTYPIGPASISNRGDFGPGDTSLGAVTMFAGQISEANADRSSAKLMVKSYIEKMAINMPRNFYQTTCLNTLYDVMCGVPRNGSFAGQNFQQAVTIFSIDSPTVYHITLPINQPKHFFRYGTIQFTDGVLCGLSLAVQAWENVGVFGNRLTLNVPPPREPALGTTAVLQAGCNKVGLYRGPANGLVDAIGTVDDAAECGAKFNNLANFRGFPHIPPPDTAF